MLLLGAGDWEKKERARMKYFSLSLEGKRVVRSGEVDLKLQETEASNADCIEFGKGNMSVMNVARKSDHEQQPPPTLSCWEVPLLNPRRPLPSLPAVGQDTPLTFFLAPKNQSAFTAAGLLKSWGTGNCVAVKERKNGLCQWFVLVQSSTAPPPSFFWSKTDIVMPAHSPSQFYCRAVNYGLTAAEL